jgi:hypothetical protein
MLSLLGCASSGQVTPQQPSGTAVTSSPLSTGANAEYESKLSLLTQDFTQKEAELKDQLEKAKKDAEVAAQQSATLLKQKADSDRLLSLARRALSSTANGGSPSEKSRPSKKLLVVGEDAFSDEENEGGTEADSAIASSNKKRAGGLPSSKSSKKSLKKTGGKNAEDEGDVPAAVVETVEKTVYDQAVQDLKDQISVLATRVEEINLQHETYVQQSRIEKEEIRTKLESEKDQAVALEHSIIDDLRQQLQKKQNELDQSLADRTKGNKALRKKIQALEEELEQKQQRLESDADRIKSQGTEIRRLREEVMVLKANATDGSEGGGIAFGGRGSLLNSLSPLRPKSYGGNGGGGRAQSADPRARAGGAATTWDHQNDYDEFGEYRPQLPVIPVVQLEKALTIASKKSPRIADALNIKRLLSPPSTKPGFK